MQIFPDAVAHKLPNYRKARRFHMTLNRVRDIRKPVLRNRLVNPQKKRLFGHFQEPPGGFGYLADRNSHGGISVITVVIDAEIQTQDVPFIQRPRGRKTMNHLFIHRRAQAVRKPPVSFEGRFSISFAGQILGHPVQGQGVDPRNDFLAQYFEYLGNQLVAVAYFLNLPGRFQDNHMVMLTATLKRPPFFQKPFVVSSEHMAFHLTDRIYGDPHNDEKSRPPEVKGHVEPRNQ